MFFSYIARIINGIFLTVLLLAEPITGVTLPFEVQNQVISQEAVIEDEKINKSSDWEIEIPKINLKAEISEGTDVKVMNQYVGHFEETAKATGNVGLAAHNRGYPVNYFRDLKLLELGDEIKYKYFDESKIYSIDKIKIIKDTNWEMLKNTEENRLTLITCIENEPEYRLCVQAVEIGGKYENQKINNNTNDNDNNDV